MPTRSARSRSDRAARPSSRTSAQAASRISALVASRRAARRSGRAGAVLSAFVFPNIVRILAHCSEPVNHRPGPGVVHFVRGYQRTARRRVVRFARRTEAPRAAARVLPAEVPRGVRRVRRPRGSARGADARLAAPTPEHRARRPLRPRRAPRRHGRRRCRRRAHVALQPERREPAVDRHRTRHGAARPVRARRGRVRHLQPVARRLLRDRSRTAARSRVHPDVGHRRVDRDARSGRASAACAA